MFLQVDATRQQMKNIQKRSVSFGKEEAYSTESISKTKDVDEICVHVSMLRRE